ncbi:MAG TPA: DUF4915 domain-containing protein [Chthoniobacterales bacterium]|nr:DUF4915 domain-containing protein [Chthoniobacterales bacterium]
MNSEQRVLVASGYGVRTTGGGLFAYNGEKLEEVDRLTTSGLFATDTQLVRLLYVPHNLDGCSELLVYDRVGVVCYYRLDGVSGVHDVACEEERFVVVSTGTNEIIWLSRGGERARTWRAPGADDSWHLNSLLLTGGRTLVSAFGRFERTREWNVAARGAGLVFDIDAGVPVLEGLHCPHNPRVFEGGWLICNSKRGELLHLSSSGTEVLRRLQLASWPRVLAVTENFIFVGESANRKAVGESGRAAIAVIDRVSWEVVDRIALPCEEVYDLVLVRPELVEGVRRGFSTNPLRVQEQDQYALFREAGVEPVRIWATGDRLPADACRVTIAAEIPATMMTGAEIEVPRGLKTLAVPPSSVRRPIRFTPPTGGSIVKCS